MDNLDERPEGETPEGGEPFSLFCDPRPGCSDPVPDPAAGSRSGGGPAGEVAGEGPAAAAARSAARRASVLEAVVLVLLALVLALSLKSYVAEAYEIKGRSMLPTFHDGERVVVLKVLYEIERGDIIIFSSKEDPAKDLIKRVVGLPGDTIRIENGVLYVNGKRQSESYLAPQDQGCCGNERYRLRENEYYVLGDNRRDSHDSRRFDGVPAENIKGKVVLRWWPFHEFRSF